MSTETDHICEEKPSQGSGLSASKKDMKGLNKYKNRTRSLFTCGGCLTKFKTVCRLHAHLEGHIEGGSYTYDHVTRTAFPKYDSVCAYTQVEQNAFALLAKKCYNKPDNKELTEDVSGSPSEITRRSKRIALRSNIAEQRAKRKKKEIGNNKSYAQQKEGNLSQNAVASESPSVNVSIEVDQTPKDLKINQCEKNRTMRTELKEVTLNGNFQPSTPHASLEHDDDRDKDSVTENSGVAKVVSVSLTHSNVSEQKTDEITASEALIAISKSADGEQNTKIEKKETVSGRVADDFHVTEHCDNYGIYEDVARLTESKKEINSVGNFTVDHRKEKKRTTEFSQDTDTSRIECQTNTESHRDSRHEKEQSKSAEKSDKVKCPVCGKLGTHSMVSYHRYLHKEQKELSCDKCGKQFQHPSCLKVHLRSHEEKIYRCDKCSEKFSRKKYLETHMLKHSGQKPYMCETCGKAYRNEMHLKRHIKHVHNQIRNFECDICKERFFRSDHLKCHRLRHFEPGLRCSFCKRKFKLPVDLARHLVIHTDEKKWFCHLCGQGFRYPVPYYNHMKKQHEIERKEACIWRKRMIEENKRNNERSKIQNISADHGETGQNNTDIKMQGVMGRKYSDITRDGTIGISVEEITVKNNSIETTETGVSIQTKEPLYKVITKYDTVSTTNSIEQTPSLYTTANSAGYSFFRVPNFNNNTPVKVLPNLASGTSSSVQGVHIPLQVAYSEGKDAETSVNRIMGYEDGNQLHDEQIVIMGEETVTDEIGVISDLEGEGMQAVMFIDECAGEVVIDQETTI